MDSGGPWVDKPQENDWHVNWHDVGVAAVTLLGIVVCTAVVIAAPFLGFFILVAADCISVLVVAIILLIFGTSGIIFVPTVITGMYESFLRPLSFRVHDNEVIRNTLSGENGLIQRLVVEGHLTRTDLDDFTRAYEELKKVSFNSQSQKYEAFNPNSPAMAKVLHYLFLHGGEDIIAGATKLISAIAPELSTGAGEGIFSECIPHIKENEQLSYFLLAFFNCKPTRPASIWDAIFAENRPGGVLINKLAITDGVDESGLKDFREMLECNPDIMQMLLNGSFKELNPDAIALYTGITKKQGAMLGPVTAT
jgi:hypothetical protein